MSYSDCLFEPDWNACIIVYGKPGVGKTAFLTAVGVQYLNRSADCLSRFQSCLDEVVSLNNSGYSFTLPTQSPVYSNYPITVYLGDNEYVESLYMDGFRFGFENTDSPDYTVLYEYPHSVILLSEAQRYYNSRRSTDLPDWVSRKFEERRHFGLLILLDTQRPDLIDINIRDTASAFYEVLSLRLIPDKHGYVVATEFTLRVFTDWKYVDAYKNGTSSVGNNFEIKKIRFDFNVFNYYQSEVYFKSFLPPTDFVTLHHIKSENKDEDLYYHSIMYPQTPPDGFYKKKKR